MGENDKSDMLSSGGWLSAISLDRSPTVLEALAAAALLEPPREPKADMMRGGAQARRTERAMWEFGSDLTRRKIADGAI